MQNEAIFLEFSLKYNDGALLKLGPGATCPPCPPSWHPWYLIQYVRDPTHMCFNLLSPQLIKSHNVYFKQNQPPSEMEDTNPIQYQVSSHFLNTSNASPSFILLGLPIKSNKSNNRLTVTYTGEQLCSLYA